MGYKYSYTWLISTMNLQVDSLRTHNGAFFRRYQKRHLFRTNGVHWDTDIRVTRYLFQLLGRLPSSGSLIQGPYSEILYPQRVPLILSPTSLRVSGGSCSHYARQKRSSGSRCRHRGLQRPLHPRPEAPVAQRPSFLPAQDPTFQLLGFL